MTYDRKLLTAALRRDFRSFVQRCFQTVSPGDTFKDNWHYGAICHDLDLCLQGKIRRLLVTVPPRSGKSICVSVALPAYALGLNPTAQIIAASYAQDLSDDLASQFRKVMETEWYQAAFPGTQIAKNTSSEFTTTRGGKRYATSVGGSLTGRGGRIVIIDDPIKPQDAMSRSARKGVINWYRDTVISRGNDKTADVVIVVMQRVHADDLVGWLLETQPDRWTHLDLPAIAQVEEDIAIGDNLYHHRCLGDVLHPERDSREVLEELKETMGSEIFSAQYLQRPVPESGNVVYKHWLRYYDQRPALTETRVVQSWDTAMKAGERNDPSVCTTWQVTGSTYYLIDVTRDRIDYPGLKQMAIGLIEKFKPNTVLIEDHGSGSVLIQELMQLSRVPIISVRPSGDKLMRMHAEVAAIQAGQVLLPREASWVAEFLHEILAFPNGRHDDQVDSLSQFLNWAREFPPSDLKLDFIDVEPTLGNRSWEAPPVFGAPDPDYFLP